MPTDQVQKLRAMRTTSARLFVLGCVLFTTGLALDVYFKRKLRTTWPSPIHVISPEDFIDAEGVIDAERIMTAQDVQAREERALVDRQSYRNARILAALFLLLPGLALVFWQRFVTRWLDEIG